MNIIAICLHSLDMRDFYSPLRHTPFLDSLRERAVFCPDSRAQGHNQHDSLNAELTGVWTARMTDSRLTEKCYQRPRNFKLPKTVIEILHGSGREIRTLIEGETYAVGGGMTSLWLAGEPGRLAQFSHPRPLDAAGWLRETASLKAPFYAHRFIRSTHRNWGAKAPLHELLGLNPPAMYPPAEKDIWTARLAAVLKPVEFQALRLKGLAAADAEVKKIFEATAHLPDTAYVVYSNHGEVFDHFKGRLPFRINGRGMIECTSHGDFPYEVVYANMQLWVIPGFTPRIIRGTGRSIDIAPTLLDLAGIKAREMDGESMLPHFERGFFPERDRYAEGPGCVSLVRADGMKVLARSPASPRLLRVLLSWGRKAAKAFPYLQRLPAMDLRAYAGLPLTEDLWHPLAVFDLKCDPGEYRDIKDTDRGREALAWAVRRHAELKGNASL